MQFDATYNYKVAKALLKKISIQILLCLHCLILRATHAVVKFRHIYMIKWIEDAFVNINCLKIVSLFIKLY